MEPFLVKLGKKCSRPFTNFEYHRSCLPNFKVSSYGPVEGVLCSTNKKTNGGRREWRTDGTTAVNKRKSGVVVADEYRGKTFLLFRFYSSKSQFVGERSSITDSFKKFPFVL